MRKKLDYGAEVRKKKATQKKKTTDHKIAKLIFFWKGGEKK